MRGTFVADRRCFIFKLDEKNNEVLSADVYKFDYLIGNNTRFEFDYSVSVCAKENKEIWFK